MKDPAQLRESLKKFSRVTAEEVARIDAETPPCEPAVDPRRLGMVLDIAGLAKAQPTIEEFLKRNKGMSVERAAQLDAETPPFVPETRPEYMTVHLTKDGVPVVRGPEVQLPEIE